MSPLCNCWMCRLSRVWGPGGAGPATHEAWTTQTTRCQPWGLPSTLYPLPCSACTNISMAGLEGLIVIPLLIHSSVPVLPWLAALGVFAVHQYCSGGSNKARHNIDSCHLPPSCHHHGLRHVPARNLLCLLHFTNKFFLLQRTCRSTSKSGWARMWRQRFRTKLQRNEDKERHRHKDMMTNFWPLNQIISFKYF